MNYFISFVSDDDFDWCVFETTDKNYAKRVYDDLVPPPEYYKELRKTSEPIDTYLSYDIIDSTY